VQRAPRDDDTPPPTRCTNDAGAACDNPEVKLWALSDLHVGHPANRQALDTLTAHPDDWLILAGDLGETRDHLRRVFHTLGPRFARLLWVPGNHELWTVASEPLRGVAKYEAMVATCREASVLTPEDPWPVFTGDGGPITIALLFLLYDYSFGPDGADASAALAWAAEAGLRCTDEDVLHPDPFPSRAAWCAARCDAAERRLAATAGPLVIVNHFPLRRELARLPRIPRFAIWCGTRRTEEWPWRYDARVVVAGHLHLRTTDWIRGVRFEEVSLGYPRQWDAQRGPGRYLREILPGPMPPPGDTGPVVHR
jgi:predicted phosphodiesterase